MMMAMMVIPSPLDQDDITSKHFGKRFFSFMFEFILQARELYDFFFQHRNPNYSLENIKAPSHIALIIPEYLVSNTNILDFIKWSNQLKTPRVSIYDKKGTLKSLNLSSSFTCDGFSTIVHYLDQSDGMERLLNLAKSHGNLDLQAIKTIIKNDDFVDVDLAFCLGNYGDPIILHSFPPFLLRLTEIMYLFINIEKLKLVAVCAIKTFVRVYSSLLIQSRGMVNKLILLITTCLGTFGNSLFLFL